MKTNYQVRYSSHPSDVKQYDTAKLREHFLVSDLFVPDEIKLVYSHFDRLIVGGIMPVNESDALEPIPPLRAEYFLERRELGIFNVGGKGTVTVDGNTFLKASNVLSSKVVISKWYFSTASVAKMPIPPPLVSTATRLPLASTKHVNPFAHSNNSSSVATLITPHCLKSAS